MTVLVTQQRWIDWCFWSFRDLRRVLTLLGLQFADIFNISSNWRPRSVKTLLRSWRLQKHQSVQRCRVTRTVTKKWQLSYYVNFFCSYSKFKRTLPKALLVKTTEPLLPIYTSKLKTKKCVWKEKKGKTLIYNSLFNKLYLLFYFAFTLV